MAGRRPRTWPSRQQMERRRGRKGCFRRLRLEPLESRVLLALDFGDAPEWYPTTLAEDGARHEATGPMLGASRDTEDDGTHSADADADGADENGATFSFMRVGQLNATVRVNVQGGSGNLDAWIDFNGDGSWGGPFEHILDSVDVSVGTSFRTFDVPSWAVAGTTYARFRLSTAGELGVGGEAADGEVEDYRLRIYPPTATTGAFSSHAVIATTPDMNDPTSVFAADVDGDGAMDVLAASRDNDRIAWYENDGSKGFTAHDVNVGSANGPMSVFVVDVDGDGDRDVLSASRNDNDITWFQNDGTQSFAAETIFGTATNANSVFAADMDGDGDLDVLSAAAGSDDEIAWYRNNGNQSFTYRSITKTAEDASSVFAADVDGDGDMDVLFAAEGDDKIAWYDNNGSGSFTYRSITTDANGARSVFATDVDGDGDTDVLSASYNDDKIAWHENNGSGFFFEHHTITSSADGANSVFAVDVDGDGDMDVLSASERDDKIAWYQNNGSQSFTAHTISTAADEAYSVFAADVDGDGDMDVISASQGDHKIAWYENENLTGWQNPHNRFDVNGIEGVTPLDVLLLINYLNSHLDDPSLPDPPSAPPPYYDVDGDGLCTAVDVLEVILEINRNVVVEPEGEAPPVVSFIPSLDSGERSCTRPSPGLSEKIEIPPAEEHEITHDRMSSLPAILNCATQGREAASCHLRKEAARDEFNTILADYESLLPDIVEDVDTVWNGR